MCGEGRGPLKTAMVRLDTLKPGEAFTLDGVSGVVVRIGPGSVTVRVNGAVKEVDFTNPDGTVRRFTAHSTVTTTWSRGTMVRGPIGPPGGP